MDRGTAGCPAVAPHRSPPPIVGGMLDGIVGCIVCGGTAGGCIVGGIVGGIIVGGPAARAADMLGGGMNGGGGAWGMGGAGAGGAAAIGCCVGGAWGCRGGTLAACRALLSTASLAINASWFAFRASICVRGHGGMARALSSCASKAISQFARQLGARTSRSSSSCRMLSSELPALLPSSTRQATLGAADEVAASRGLQRQRGPAPPHVPGPAALPHLRPGSWLRHSGDARPAQSSVAQPMARASSDASPSTARVCAVAAGRGR
jgi:hypothetical protein